MQMKLQEKVKKFQEDLAEYRVCLDEELAKVSEDIEG